MKFQVWAASCHLRSWAARTANCSSASRQAPCVPTGDIACNEFAARCNVESFKYECFLAFEFRQYCVHDDVEICAIVARLKQTHERVVDTRFRTSRVVKMRQSMQLKKVLESGEEFGAEDVVIQAALAQPAELLTAGFTCFVGRVIVIAVQKQAFLHEMRAE